jgi:hypothetical protein
VDVWRWAAGVAFQRHDHRALPEVGKLSVFQQPAVDHLDRSHAVKDTGDHHLRGDFSVRKLDLKFIPNAHSVQSSAVDIGGVDQIVITGNDVDGAVVMGGLGAEGQGHQET